MAGQPKAPFYFAVFGVIVALVAFAAYRAMRPVGNAGNGPEAKAPEITLPTPDASGGTSDAPSGVVALVGARVVTMAGSERDSVLENATIVVERNRIAAVGPHVRPDAILMDVTSLKQAPLAAMLAASGGAPPG